MQNSQIWEFGEFGVMTPLVPKIRFLKEAVINIRRNGEIIISRPILPRSSIRIVFLYWPTSPSDRMFYGFMHINENNEISYWTKRMSFARAQYPEIYSNENTTALYLAFRINEPFTSRLTCGVYRSHIQREMISFDLDRMIPSNVQNIINTYNRVNDVTYLHSNTPVVRDLNINFRIYDRFLIDIITERILFRYTLNFNANVHHGIVLDMWRTEDDSIDSLISYVHFFNKLNDF